LFDAPGAEVCWLTTFTRNVGSRTYSGSENENTNKCGRKVESIESWSRRSKKILSNVGMIDAKRLIENMQNAEFQNKLTQIDLRRDQKRRSYLVYDIPDAQKMIKANLQIKILIYVLAHAHGQGQKQGERPLKRKTHQLVEFNVIERPGLLCQ
jgi:hypothetical protein